MTTPKGIRYLDRLWRVGARTVNVMLTAIASNDLDFWVFGEPGGERFRRTVGKEINGSMGFQIDQDSALAGKRRSFFVHNDRLNFRSPKRKQT